jgi:iron complex outermembrane receptor protein
MNRASLRLRSAIFFSNGLCFWSEAKLFRISGVIVFFCLVIAVQAQQPEPDSVIRLEEVVVQGYMSHQSLLKSPASAGVLNENALQKSSQQSLLPAINTVPGIRMEERSPGSYRLSIRGSLLRSPFGVRNVKVYLDDLPLTDASGNTYVNIIDPALLSRIEILKGPDGSLFGANSGGVVLMNTHDDRDSTSIRGDISGGSYGMFRESIHLTNSTNRFQWNIKQAFQRADGYREQSFMKRFNGVAAGRLKYGLSNNLNLSVLYSDLQYETPGGLTAAQFKENPQQARPAAGPNPGAVEQHSGVFNKTLFGGVTNDLQLSSGIRHVVSVFGTFTDFVNPFITTYETRDEKNAGIRTYIEYSLNKNKLAFQWNTGLEAQWGNQQISNYTNDGGQKGQLQSSDDIDIRQAFYFTRATLDVGKVTTEMVVSLNQYRYDFEGLEGTDISNEWMPRVALSYQLISELAFRLSVSRGYSPPTIAEIRPSGGVVNTTLQAESGWNREAGFRFTFFGNRIQMDASVFRFDLTNAIVRRTDQNDVEYFTNAGGTKQTGVECLLNVWLLSLRESGFFRGLSIKGSYTYSHFVFDDYQIDDADYSGNWLTGVPKNILVLGMTLQLPEHISVFAQLNSTSSIPLNDGNTDYADRYNLLQVRIDWHMISQKRKSVSLFIGADNLLDQKYSLGNDINAFGGRYYNAAPPRNFYTGLTLMF